MRNKSSSSVKVFLPPYRRKELIELLRARVGDLAKVLPIKRVVLFGSWAKGNATTFSDIDLLVIYADPPREDAYRLVWKTLRLQGLEPHVYTEREATQIASTIERMTKDGVTIFEA